MFDSQAGAAPALMTIGYEGASINDFVATLKIAGVKRLLDIRQLPLSRKKGFSKNALRDAVESEGIEYTHFKDLGDPKPGRDAAKSGDFVTFRKIFNSHMATPEAKLALKSVIDIASEGGACLLCFERCHDECHRNIVAKEIGKQSGIPVRHIGVKHGIATESTKSVR